MAGAGIWRNIRLFPERRFDADFSLIFWLAGLWFLSEKLLVLLLLVHVGVGPYSIFGRCQI